MSTNTSNIDEYAAQIAAWRVKREQGLRAPDSWLSLTNLHILEDGAHSIGSATDNAVALPASAPAHLGVLRYADGAAVLEITCSEEVQVDGKPATGSVALRDNKSGAPSLVTAGTCIFFIHAFSGIHAVRVKDTANPLRQSFPGCVWFDADPAYRVRGTLERYAEKQVLSIRTVRDTPDDYGSVGRVRFILHGREFVFEAMAGGQDTLFIVFRDATSGKTTYPAARFVFPTVSADGTVDLDFNKAINPPCAFSVYATCPMPPAQNILPIAIEAGEKDQGMGIRN
jgi:uncharacterized protein (DUF1684 family)